MPHLFLLALTLAAEPSLKIAPGDARQVRVVAVLSPMQAKGLPDGVVNADQGEALLEFAIVDADSGKAGAAMLGRYEHKDGQLTFTPRHALVAGEKYRATLHLGGKKSLTADHDVPAKKATPAGRVELIYPTLEKLPANLLKFYIYFSKPMRESKTIFDHLRILDDKGNPVYDPWRRTELWSKDGKRLTLWIHPGRIKKGVNLREDEGPVLEPDRTYTLEIGAKLLDEDGKPLEKTFTKKFRATKAERRFVLLEDWKPTVPKAGTRTALGLAFPKPLDHALLVRYVKVIDRSGKEVPGQFTVGKEEKSMTFVPEQAWKQEAHQVVVDGRLEDVAGNTPDALFDVDNEEPDPEAKPQKLTFLPGK